MSEKQSKRRLPQRLRRAPRRDALNGPIGQVVLSGSLLEIDFLYSPERVEAIKAIPQARFHRETKRWTVPVRHRELLERSQHFGRDVLEYRFPPGVLDEENKNAADVEAAVSRWRENPFQVSPADLELLDLDIIFSLHRETNALRARPRFRSPAQKLLEKLPGSHYLKSERAYYLSTEALPDFLKRLRDNSLGFAVDAEAGSRLSESAELRTRLRAAPDTGSAEELEAALLTPYIHGGADDDGNLSFCFRGYTTQQLRECFPDARSFAERRELARCFSEEELVSLIARLPALPFRVWRSVDASWHIERLGERFSRRSAAGSVLRESLAKFLDVPACWARGSGSRGGLLLSPEFYKEHFASAKNNPLKKIPKELLPGATEKYFFALPSRNLASVKAEIDQFLADAGASLPIVSSEFESFSTELAARDKLRKECRAYQGLREADLSAVLFSDETVAAKLFPHQRVAVSWLLSRSRAFLGDDMGLGKTLSVLATFDALKERGEVDFLLVLCPNSLLRNWVREAERWTPKRRLIRLPEDKRGKVLLFKQLGWGGVATDGLVVNYEAGRLDYVAAELQKLCENRRTLLCLDESQRVKSPSAKSFLVLRELAPRCPRRILLSGTPTPKDISDIWAQMLLLDDGERFGTNFYEWLGTVAELGNRFSDYAVKRYRPEEVEEVVGRVHEVLLRRRKEEVVQLPEKTFLVRDVELKGDQAKRYDEVREQLLLRMTSISGKEFVREIDNILEEYLRAVQMASNPRLVDETWKGTPAKFDELDSLLEEIVGERDEKVVVWTNYLGNVRELTKRYEKYGAAAFSGEVSTADRDKALQEFQQGKKIRVLVAVPAAGGVGITLTAAQTAIYVDKTWNAEHWLQSVDRLHRIGQTGTVRIISLQACLVDELIAKNLARKARQQAEVLGDTRNVEVEIEPSREELLRAVGEGG